MFCMNCKYPLCYLETCRCPECGRPFTPEDERTYLNHPQQPDPELSPSPRLRKQQLLDRQQDRFIWSRLFLFSMIGLVLMYWFFVAMFGPIERFPDCWTCYTNFLVRRP